MGLAEKMLTKPQKVCTLRSNCKHESDRRYFDELFENEWDVFIIRRDEKTGELDWTTQCCEGAKAKYAKPNTFSAPCR